MHFIVDGDSNADTYGHARSELEALARARAQFVDHVTHVELYGPIHLANGQTLDKAYVAFTEG